MYVELFNSVQTSLIYDANCLEKNSFEPYRLQVKIFLRLLIGEVNFRGLKLLVKDKYGKKAKYKFIK